MLPRAPDETGGVYYRIIPEGTLVDWDGGDSNRRLWSMTGFTKFVDTSDDADVPLGGFHPAIAGSAETSRGARRYQTSAAGRIISAPAAHAPSKRSRRIGERDDESCSARGFMMRSFRWRAPESRTAEPSGPTPSRRGGSLP